MTDWTPVLPRKETKHINALYRFVEEAVDIVNKRNIDYTSLVDISDRIVNNNPCGTMKPVTVSWPSVIPGAEPGSPLLSERAGSTDGKVLAKSMYLYEYAKFADLMEQYSVPIYHIDYEEHTDMGYDHKGRRAPYTESVTISIWTYAANQAPVVHTYELDVGRYKKKDAPCCYRYSYSPVHAIAENKDTNYECHEFPMDFVDCTHRMMELCA